MQWIERQWSKRNLLTLALWPLSVIFRSAVALRRILYRTGLIASTRFPMPVIVVGNLTVGGTGKTPLVLWLSDLLRSQGFHPGIISRGYGGTGQDQAQPQRVTHDSPALVVGDEPLLLARRAQVPVYVGRRRATTAQLLIRNHPECNVLLCDDGMQHYGLARDIEVAVIDGERGFGNALLLPAGPLREPVSRLATVDAIVFNGGHAAQGLSTYAMHLSGDRFVNLAAPDRTQLPAGFANRPLHAVAAIGNPLRFFQHLQSLGLRCSQHAFLDHHRFQSRDFDFAGDDVVVMTEKDAVKCAAFAKPNWWFLPVNAQVDPALGDLILAKVRALNGR